MKFVEDNYVHANLHFTLPCISQNADGLSKAPSILK